MKKRTNIKPKIRQLTLYPEDNVELYHEEYLQKMTKEINKFTEYEINKILKSCQENTQNN